MFMSKKNLNIINREENQTNGDKSVIQMQAAKKVKTKKMKKSKSKVQVCQVNIANIVEQHVEQTPSVCHGAVSAPRNS